MDFLEETDDFVDPLVLIFFFFVWFICTNRDNILSTATLLGAVTNIFL